MVCGFLLHDPPNMCVRGVSVKGKFGIGGRGVGVAPPPPGAVLPVGRLPERKRSSLTFWPLPSGDQSKVSKLEHSWAKNDSKSLPCLENVAADILRGWAVFDFGSVIGREGCSSLKLCVQESLEMGCKNAFIKVNGKTIGG